jgi:hypothetical protein
MTADHIRVRRDRFGYPGKNSAGFMARRALAYACGCVAGIRDFALTIPHSNRIIPAALLSTGISKL